MNITEEEKKDLEELRNRLKLADQLGNVVVYFNGEYTEKGWCRLHNQPPNQVRQTQSEGQRRQTASQPGRRDACPNHGPHHPTRSNR